MVWEMTVEWCLHKRGGEDGERFGAIAVTQPEMMGIL